MNDLAVPDDLILTDQRLHQEADELLNDKGLLRLLESFGKPHVLGSYSLGTMVWRDLDFNLENGAITEHDFFELGGRLASVVSPTKMNYRDTRTQPVGLYWGVYMNHRSEDGWKIDIWAIDSGQYKGLKEFQDSIEERITASSRLKILSIKPAVWRDPRYGHNFTSVEVYRAVLDHGIEDEDGFRKYLSDQEWYRGDEPH